VTASLCSGQLLIPRRLQFRIHPRVFDVMDAMALALTAMRAVHDVGSSTRRLWQWIPTSLCPSSISLHPTSATADDNTNNLLTARSAKSQG